MPVLVTTGLGPEVGVATISKLVMPVGTGPVQLQDTVADPVVPVVEAVARPIVGAVGTATDRVWSVNCSRSTLRTVSMPSLTNWVGRLTAPVWVTTMPAAAEALAATGTIVVASPRSEEDRRVAVGRRCGPAVRRSHRRGRVHDLADGDQVARVDETGEHRLLQGHAGGAGPEVPGRCGALHEIGGADLGGRVGRVGADTDPDLQGPVPVDDVVSATTGDRVAAADRRAGCRRRPRSGRWSGRSRRPSWR